MEHCLSKIYLSLLLFLRLFDSDIESSLHESDFQSDPDKMSSHMSDTDAICDSEVDIMDNIAEFDENRRFLCAVDVEADPICRRLDKLIRDGNISKDQIFYKYLDNITQIYYDSKHPYNKDVTELFASIAHHGGGSAYNIVRGPMGFGNRQSSSNEIRMNLGGPGIETLR